jgi:hypothetical protein
MTSQQSLHLAMHFGNLDSNLELRSSNCLPWVSLPGRGSNRFRLTYNRCMSRNITRNEEHSCSSRRNGSAALMLCQRKISTTKLYNSCTTKKSCTQYNYPLTGYMYRGKTSPLTWYNVRAVLLSWRSAWTSCQTGKWLRICSKFYWWNFSSSIHVYGYILLC